jgi:defect-in-organelle-trafficking protein DotD
MDTKRLLLMPFCCFIFVLTACSSTKKGLSVNEIQTQNANIQIAQAATTTSNALTQLGSLERAVTPPLALKNLPDPNNYNMDSLASIDWAGPVGPIVRQIAQAGRYQLRVLGRPPAVPVLISINEKNMPLGYILRDIDFQCGNKANIVVFPQRRVIELRYGRS